MEFGISDVPIGGLWFGIPRICGQSPADYIDYITYTDPLRRSHADAR